VPAQFYIANVGGARSAGVELEAQVRAHQHLDLFAVLGRTSSELGHGSRALGIDVSGNELPGTPKYTATIGGEPSVAIGSAALYGRAEVAFFGAFKYDETNTIGQAAYSLANFRVGVRARALFIEGWIRNAFDTRYVPVAFAYPGFAPSGYMGEPGRPRTFGINGGVRF
jgi:iron complex outermembrane receptor protein